MSEALPKQPERQTTPEQTTSEDHERHSQRIEQEHQNAAEKAPSEHSTEQLSAKVESLALSGKEHSRVESEKAHAPSGYHPVVVQKHLKDMAYSRTMTRVRKQLNVADRTLSKITHNRLIEKPSELAGKTIARPSGMLGGAFFAAIGTSVLLYVTRRYGYEYNYLMVLIFFAGGLVAGLLGEFLWRNYKRRTSR